MEFVGQEQLFKTINGYTLKTMPHTILLLGEEGCGKKTIVKYIANKLKLELTVINKKIEPEQLTEYQQSAIKRLYMIDLTELRLEKDQNQFLKFIEEPSENSYIILINTSEIGILQTVLNRCVKLRFEPYTTEQLKQIKSFNNDFVYKVCKTPGQLSQLSEEKVIDMYNVCDTIVHKLNIASYPNTISIAARINYKEDYKKFDFTTFLNMLEAVASESYLKENNLLALHIYLYSVSRRQGLVQNSSIAKENFMLSYLDGLWRAIR